MDSDTKFLLVACCLFSIPFVYQLSSFAAIVMAIMLIVTVYILIEMRGLR